jgi:DNA-binding transcriptional MocR family regulator
MTDKNSDFTRAASSALIIAALRMMFFLFIFSVLLSIIFSNSSFCRRAGRFEPDIRERVTTYRAHRDVMAHALRERLPEASFALPQGGYYLWLRLPEGVDGDALASRAETLGVQVLPASQFHATPGPRNYLRLAYSYASPSEIVEGVRRLARAFRQTE